MFGKKDKTGQGKKRRIRIHEATLENDIRYIGPISFQHFQLLGWLCIALSQVAVILALGGRIDGQFATDTARWKDIIENIAQLSLPFLLIANFAQILDTENGYRKQLIKNLAATVAVCGVFYLLFYRYIVGNIAAFLKDPGQALPTVQSAINQGVPIGFFDFNIFVDLLMCTLTMFFLNYKPRRVFTGKSRFLFRLMALLPIAYEVGGMVLKVRSARGLVEIPVWAWPLMTVKPPMTFVLFVALALFVKTRELRFRRHGKTHEEYLAFLKTKRNSWNFSVFLAVMLVIVSIVDILVLLGFSVSEGVSLEMTRMKATQETVQQVDETAPELEQTATEINADAAEADAVPPETNADAATDAEADAVPAETNAAEAATDAEIDEELTQAVTYGAMVAIAVGFGESSSLLLLAPVVLLFSYTRKPKYPWIGLLIPAAGVILILLIYLEGGHQLLYRLPIEKIDLEELKQTLMLYAMMPQ